MKTNIMDILPVGKENAISTADLSRFLGINNERELRIFISCQRERGAVILSSSKGGYYKSNDPEEIKEYIRYMTKMGRRTIGAAKSAREYLKMVEGQLSLDIASSTINE